MTYSIKPLTLIPFVFALAACGGGDTSVSAPSAARPTPAPASNNWSAQAYVKASNGSVGFQFGESVALSGDTLAVGAAGESSSDTTITNGNSASADHSAINAGAAYVFVRSGSDWSQQAYLKASNAESADIFGSTIAISGDTIVVGANQEDSNQTTITNGSTSSTNNSAVASGAAYVFVRNGSTWSQQAYLKASNAGVSDGFGKALAISGDTIVVGTFSEDSNQTTITNGSTASTDDSAVTSGAAYVFVRSDNTWSQQAYLKAANARSDGYFGQSVSISADTIVVGAIGDRSNQTTITNGSTASSDTSATASGAAFVFVRNGSTWSQQAYLKASNANSSDFFGQSVGISGDTIVVGADGEDSNQTTITNGSTASADNSTSFSGAAYVFVRSGNDWSQQAYFKAPNAEANDNFGARVAISGDTVVVGASDESSNQTTITNGSTASANNAASSAGAAYVFVRNTSDNTWSHQAYLKAPNAEGGDRFASSLAVSGNTIVVGSKYEDGSQTTITNGSTASADNTGSNFGAAYVFARN
ncbi:FG-GAP repeat [Comamonadaceae bacterium]